MHRASHVMYSIANFFTWILVLLSIAGIVFSSLAIANVLPELKDYGFGTGYLVYCAIVLIFSMITIWMVRKAKARGTSKGWDVLFLVLGILGANIFYILGGIFGLCERK